MSVALAQENERLVKEVTELNDTVFSRSFKAPSAWAEREVKYKAEKRDWTAQVQRLQGTIERLREENLGYRASNKTTEFETRIQVSCTACPPDSCMSCTCMLCHKSRCDCVLALAVADCNSLLDMRFGQLHVVCAALPSSAPAVSLVQH